MSITPAAGLTLGGGGGKPAWAQAPVAAMENSTASADFIQVSSLGPKES
jgi:hypothetical protein